MSMSVLDEYCRYYYRPRSSRPSSKRRKRILHWCLQKWLVIYLAKIASRQSITDGPGYGPDPALYFTTWHKLILRYRSDMHLAHQYRYRRIIWKSFTIWFQSYQIRLHHYLIDIRLKFLWTRWKYQYLYSRYRRALIQSHIRTWRRYTCIRILTKFTDRMSMKVSYNQLIVYCKSMRRIETLIGRSLHISANYQERQQRRQRMHLRMYIGQWRDTVYALNDIDRNVDAETRLKLLRRMIREWHHEYRYRYERLSAVMFIISIFNKMMMMSSLTIWRRFLMGSRRQTAHLIRLEMSCRRIRWCFTVRYYIDIWKRAIESTNVIRQYWHSWMYFIQLRNDKLQNRRRLEIQVVRNGQISMKEWQEQRLKQLVINSWIMELAMKYCIMQTQDHIYNQYKLRIKYGYYRRWRSAFHIIIRQYND